MLLTTVDLAPRMSGRMQNGVVADGTILTVDTAEGLVEWTRPALGGNILRKSFLQTIVHKWALYVPTYLKDREGIADSWGRIQVEQSDL